MKQPTSRILYNYWNEVRGRRLAPRRFEIEPSRISSILSETFILEDEGDGYYPFRLAGTRICEHFGAELRGTDFADLLSPERYPAVDLLARSGREGGVVTIEIDACDASGRCARFEAVLMPLTHPATEVTRFLGALSAIDPPFWLGAAPIETSAAVSSELFWPQGRPHSVVALSQSQTPFSPLMAEARIVRSARRQFRIFDGGRKG